MSEVAQAWPTPALVVDLMESAHAGRKGALRCEVDRDIRFNTEYLESYCFANWDPVIYDALLLAGGVEFVDRCCRRSTLSWARRFSVSVPVHEPARWNDPKVHGALEAALGFLTGDYWDLQFRKRRASLTTPRQGRFQLPSGVSAVIPFSEGLDSRAVAGLVAKKLGDSLVRVRLGTKKFEQGEGRKKPFTAVPYRVTSSVVPFVESTARTRGFKFALISGLAAYLSGARTVIIPESGQGSLGPALVTVGQAYPDFRSHPSFTARMEVFLRALLGSEIRFEFPRIWNTKGETLREFVDQCDDGSSWSSTWSCWQQNRQVSVNGKKRHCGVCAACLLRRLSVHAAGLTEKPDFYVWEDLGAAEFAAGAAADFPRRKITGRLHQYAVAGVLHLDHLADLLTSKSNQPMLELTSFQLAEVLGGSQEENRQKLERMLRQHRAEWCAFRHSVGKNSFIQEWACVDEPA